MVQVLKEAQQWAPNLVVRWYEGHVAEVHITRGPHNFFDVTLIRQIAEAYAELDADADVRCVLLSSEGRNFCAGADFRGVDTSASATPPNNEEHLYDAAVKLFAIRKPVVALLQGKSVGGGAGLALTPDFRVGEADSSMWINFSRLSSHHGFGLTATLNSVVGQQRAAELLVTGRRILADEMHEWRLIDRITPQGELFKVGYEFAREIASAGPLAVEAILETLRAGREDRFRAATQREKAAQEQLFPTADRAEGVRAVAERREPNFTRS